MAGSTVPSGLRALLNKDTAGWLVNRVDEYLVRAEEQRLDPGWFHPSSLGEKCDALLMFEYLGVRGKQEIAAQTRRIFDLGNDRDKAWKGYLFHSKLSVFPREDRSPYAECGGCGLHPVDNGGFDIGVPWRHICIPELRIRGELDDVVRNPFTKELFVFEMKTKNNDLFTKLNAPDPAHITQSHCYMVAKRLSKALVNYENKNNQTVKTFGIEYDPALWEPLAERLRSIRAMVESGDHPLRTPMANESWCKFHEICDATHTTKWPEYVAAYKNGGN